MDEYNSKPCIRCDLEFPKPRNISSKEFSLRKYCSRRCYSLAISERKKYSADEIKFKENYGKYPTLNEIEQFIKTPAIN